MSITAETVQAHLNDPAVLCCRCEEGTTLTAANFEDPNIFPDLIDAGLLNVEGALTLGQVMNGTVLTKTSDSLTPITPDIVDRYDEVGGGSEAEEAEEVQAVVAAPAVSGSAEGVTMAAFGGVLKLHIGEGRDIDIEFPL